MLCEQPFFIFNRRVVEISILRINPILYVLKQLFDQNQPLILFTLFYIIIDILMNSYNDTIYNLLQVPNSIYLLLIVDLCVLYLLGNRTLILKLVLGCDRKFSVGSIQTGHTDLLPPQACGRLWRGCQFFYCTCCN